MLFRKSAFLAVFAAMCSVVLASCGGGSSVNTVPVSVATTPPPGGPTTSLALTGLLSTPGTLAIAQLNALPQTSVTTNAQTSTGSLGVHTYTGPLLYNVLESAGPTADPTIKNDLLRRGIVITGSDGYQTGIAWGEIDPRFAGKQIIVATSQDGAPLPASSGFARLIVPGDVFAGRYISNVASINIENALAAQPQLTLTPTLSFVLAGLVNNQGVYSAANLASLPQTSVTVSSSGTSHVYTGPLLINVLNNAVLKLNPAIKNDQLTKSVISIGSDGYTSILTAGEIDPKFGNVQVLVATSEDGAPLPSTTGFARIVVPGDVAAGRYVSSLADVQVGQL
jgi:DMSO/TMAO reductase YedYZ molybdopterin-dependent catalytic subunit